MLHPGPVGTHPQRRRGGRGGLAGDRGEDPGGDRDVGAEQAHVVKRGGQWLHARDVDRAERRLEAGDPAVVRGDADRPPGIGSQGHAARAGADQGGRAAAGTAGGPPRAERVARLGHAGVHCPGGVLKQRRGREDLGSCLAQGSDHGGVAGRGRRGHVVRVSVPARVPGNVDHVLHCDGDAVQRAVRPAGGRGEQADHGVQRPAQAERPFAAGQQFEVGDLAGPLAPLDRVDQLTGVAGQRAGQVAEQVIDLGLAPADHQVAVDAAVRLGALPVEPDQAGQRPLEVTRVEAVEALRADRRLGQYLPGGRQHQRPPPRIRQRVSDRQIGHRPGVQHGPVCLLAPQKAHDVAGGLGVGQRLRQLEHPLADATLRFADPEGTDVALHDQPRFQPVRAEVHEADHHAVRAHGRGQGSRRQAVLKRDNVAIGVEAPAEEFGRGGCVMALHGHGRPGQ